MVIEAIGKGMVVGLGLAFAIGPVFFALLDTSITRGFKAGAQFATGILLSDALYALLFWLGVGSLLQGLSHSVWLAVAGGAILLALGLTAIFKKPDLRRHQLPTRSRHRSRLRSLGKGFVLNTFNPGTSVVWLGAGAAGADLAAAGGHGLQGLYSAVILATTFGTDLAKAYLAKRLNRVLSRRNLIIVNRVAGGIMAAAGAYLILSACQRIVA